MDPTPPPADVPEPLPLPQPVEDSPALLLPTAQPTPAEHPEPDHPHPPLGFSVRRFAHIVVLLFSLFLIVRTTFVEPFGVTTGSMAITILGNRRVKECPRCGFPIQVGSADDTPGRPNPQAGVYCPNCGAGKFDLSDEPETFGDRLMVDKLVFNLRTPRRWEVAVFRCPDPETRPDKLARDELAAFEARLPIEEDRKPYVKRVVGLPGERILVADGDVYADGVLQRKHFDQVRETRIPVFQMEYAPQADGWAARWEVGPVVGTPRLPKDTSPPPSADVVQGTTLALDATTSPLGLTYRHRDLDSGTDLPVTDRLGYNGVLRREPLPVHDFMVSCEVEVLGGKNGAFALRLGDGADTVKVHLPVQAETTAGTALIAHEGGTEVPFDTPFALVPGSTYQLEFAFVDRRVLLAIDGREVVKPLDLPAVPTGGRRPRTVTGKWVGLDRPVQLGCQGAHVVVHHFTLWRDIHYRGDDSKHGVTAECPLGADEYFMLGDNTANSRDSREWDTPGVPEHDFLGKPFLVHQPLKAGTAPVLGRVQAIDWERLRLLE